MLDLILWMLEATINNFNLIPAQTASDTSMFTSAGIDSIITAIAMSIKPIGYSLLGMFCLIEFATLSEKVGNVHGFAGAGLVINVLIKIMLCKIVVDHSTDICTFLLYLGDLLTSKIGTTGTQSVDFAALKRSIEGIFPEWYDIFSQLGFFILSMLVCFLCSLSTIVVRVIFAARMIELYVYSAISPIPIATIPSKQFNMAVNFFKSFFAVALQGTLLMIIVKIFNQVTAGLLNNMIATSSSDWGGYWSILLTLLFLSILMLVSATFTGRWAKSICHAM